MLLDKNEVLWTIAIVVALLLILNFAADEGYRGDICGGAAGQTSSECP